MLRTIANSGHLKTQIARLTQLAYYQAGKIVVQTLLPEHPPTALISINSLGITTATGADTYIPVDSSSSTHWCSSLESRLIGLYGGRATSSLLESQYAAIPRTKLVANHYRPLDTTTGSLNNELKVQQNDIESNVLQSDIGNAEIQSATRLAVTMINKWNLYSLKNIVIREDHTTSVEKIVNQKVSVVGKKLLRYNEAFVTQPILQPTKSKGKKGYPTELSKVPTYFLPHDPEGVRASLTFTPTAASQDKPRLHPELEQPEVAHHLGLQSRIPSKETEVSRHRPLWGKQQVKAEKSPVKSNTGWTNSFIGSNTKTKFITFPYQPTLIRQMNVGSKNNQTLFLESYLRYFKLPMLLSYPLSRRGLVDVSRKEQKKVDQSFTATKFKVKASKHLTPHFNQEKQLPSVSWEKIYDAHWLYTSEENFVNHKNAVKNDSIKAQKLEFTLWNNEKVLLRKPVREIGEDLKFLLSSPKNSGSLNGDGVTTNAINKVVAEAPITKSLLAMPQRFLLNEHRTLVENVVKKNVSRVNVFQLVNPIQFSNVQRDRFYPSWFRLYLPDIEVTEFIKNVANYYFSLGLQTLTRPSLNEFNFLLGSLGSDCSIKSSVYSSLASSFSNLTFTPTVASQDKPRLHPELEQPEVARHLGLQSRSPLKEVAHNPEEVRLDKGAYTQDPFGVKGCSFTPEGYQEDCSIKQLPDSKLSETKFLQHTKTELLDPLITGPTVPFSPDFLTQGSGSTLLFLKKGESSIRLIQNVFFCCGDNNLSIGIGLLRHAAKRRSQQNVKKHHLVISQPKQNFKIVSYPKLSVALWGLSRPWHFIHLGFRQKTIQPSLPLRGIKNNKVLQNNSLDSNVYPDGLLPNNRRLHPELIYLKWPEQGQGATYVPRRGICLIGKDQKRGLKNTPVRDNKIDATLWYKLTTAKYYSSLYRLFDRTEKKIDICAPLDKSYNIFNKANDKIIDDAKDVELSIAHRSEKRAHDVDTKFSDTQNISGHVHMQPLRLIDKQADHQNNLNNLDPVSSESKVFSGNLLFPPIPNPERVVDLRSMFLTPFGSSDLLSTRRQLMTPNPFGVIELWPERIQGAYTQYPFGVKGYSARNDCLVKPSTMKECKSSWCNQRLLHKSLGKTIKQEKNKFTPLDLSFSLFLEKQIFPAPLRGKGFSNISVMEKEFVFHALITNSFAKAFFLVDKNRQLIDYFADSLIRFQILRQHQILHLFSAMLLRCKKET